MPSALASPGSPLRNGEAPVRLPLYLLAAGLVVNVMAYTPYSLFLVAGKAGLLARCGLAHPAPYFIYTAALTHRYGAAGAAAAWALRVTIDGLVLFYLTRRGEQRRCRLLPANGWAYLLALVLLLAPALLAAVAAAPTVVTAGMLLAGLAGCGNLIWRRVLTAGERAWMSAMLRPPLPS